MTHSLEDIKALIFALEEDINLAIAKVNSSEDEFDFYARSYLRALATWIEGSLWLHKTIVREVEFDWNNVLPIESQLYLAEYDWKIDSRGKPKRETKKIPTKQNLKSFFYVMGQLFENYEADLGGEGWAAVLHFYDLRDRMMHPSGLASLVFSKPDIQRCDTGRLWLKDQFLEIRKNAVEYMDA